MDDLVLGQNLKIGTVVTLPDLGLAELTATVADFVWIDLEHGALGIGDVQPLAIAARSGGAAALVRLAGADDPALGAALDAGVDGVVVPRVEGAADAHAAVERLRHPPRGTRGMAARRATRYGLGADTRQAPVARGGHGDPLCVVQVETAGALDECEAIAAVDGVDALVVGCADLALALGEDPGGPAEDPGAPAEDPRLPRDPIARSAALRHAIRRVQLAAGAAGIASGVAGPDDPELLLELAGGASSMLVLGADVRLYARALDAAVARVRDGAAVDEPDRSEARVGA